MRFVGLIDPSSTVYNTWRVPQPLAPYPQDYIIDQAGIVRYWSDQFDARAVIETIDRLLATGMEESPRLQPSGLKLETWPNPCRGVLTLCLPPADHRPREVRVFSSSGRLVLSAPVPCSPIPCPHSLDLRFLPAGVYHVRLRCEGGEFSATAAIAR